MSLSDVLAVIGILVSAFIAYNIYFLSKRLTFQDTLLNAAQIREKTDPLLADIRKGNSSKIEFINVKRYKKDYPHNNEKSRHGYTYQGAELKGYSYDGVEFFNTVHKGYLDAEGKLTLTETKKAAGFNVFEVGVVPYEWIVYVDPIGDDTAYRPQFFAKFKGKFKTPYKTARYYRTSEHYDPKNDPLVMKYMSVELGSAQ
jgi:hypothetical protein